MSHLHQAPLQSPSALYSNLQPTTKSAATTSNKSFSAPNPKPSHRSPRQSVLDIKLPLRKHPNKTHNRERQHPPHSRARLSRPKEKPLRPKMCHGNSVGPATKRIRNLIVDVVGGVQAHDACQKVPRTYQPCGEISDLGSGFGAGVGA